MFLASANIKREKETGQRRSIHCGKLVLEILNQATPYFFPGIKRSETGSADLFMGLKV